MTQRAQLNALTDALDGLIEGSTAFLDLETGEVHVVARETRELANDYSRPLDDRPAWQQAAIERLWDIQDRSSVYLALPSRENLPETAMMEIFCRSIESREAHEHLFRAIHGKKAYHLFRAALERFGIEDNWRAFRRSQLRRFAQDWCEEQGVAWE